jgi:FixJ family two-component response regulator
MPMRAVISIIDDDPSVREGTTDLLNAIGFVTESFECAEDFLNSSRVHSTACVIADVQMPGMTGLELQNRLVLSGNPIPMILITAFPNYRDRTRAMTAGVECYVTKPFSENELLACISKALKCDRRTS